MNPLIVFLMCMLLLCLIVSLVYGAVSPTAMEWIAPLALFPIGVISLILAYVLAFQHGLDIAQRQKDLPILYKAASHSCNEQLVEQFNVFQDLHPLEYHTPVEWNAMLTEWQLTKPPIQACLDKESLRAEGDSLFKDKWYVGL